MKHDEADKRVRVRLLLQGLREADAANELLQLGPCTCKADAAAVACANERQGSCRGFKAAEAVEKGVGDEDSQRT